MQNKKVYYLGPALLAVLMFTTNFLGTDIFEGASVNFSVWFVISIFAFATGWIINISLGWEHGGKIVFAVIIATTVFSIFLVSFFNDYFGPNELLSESLILYSLRNVTIGLMGVFGMAISNVILLQREVERLKSEKSNAVDVLENSKKEAELIVEEAKINAGNIVLDAKKQANEIIETRNNIERQLKELIQIEKDLIKKYEDKNE